LIDYISFSCAVATYGEFPWQASIKFLGSHSCGGSLLSSRYAREVTVSQVENCEASTKFLASNL
jgi:hypothetical protein